MKVERQIKPMRIEACLCEHVRHDVHTNHALRPTSFHFKRKESRIASDIEHGLAAQIFGNEVGEKAPSTQRVIRIARIAHDLWRKYDVVIPRTELPESLCHLCQRSGIPR